MLISVIASRDYWWYSVLVYADVYTCTACYRNVPYLAKSTNMGSGSIKLGNGKLNFNKRACN